MKLTLEQFETQWAENNLSVTDWFDTTYGLFKELEALQSRSCEGCKYEVKYYECIECSNNFTCSRQIFTDRYEPKEQL